MEPDGPGTSDGVAARGFVNGKGPQAKRSGRDSAEGAYRTEVPGPQATRRRSGQAPAGEIAAKPAKTRRRHGGVAGEHP